MTPLKKGQIKLIKYGLKHPYSILAGDTGTGKTRAAIEIALRDGRNTLIICPSYQVLNWVDEINKWGPLDSKILAIKKSKDVEIKKGINFIVVSYDIAKKHECLFKWAINLFLDEAHLIKSVKAKRTQSIHKMIYENSVARVHPMSGTIIKNRVEEFYANLALTYYDPRISSPLFLRKFPDSISFAEKFSFRLQYTIEIGGRLITITKWKGLRNFEQLKKWLDGKYIRVKSDIKSENVYKNILISDSQDEALLNQFKNYFLGEDSTGVDPEAKAKAALAKAPMTIKYVEDLLESSEPIVIFSDHVEASEYIADHFKTTAMNHNVGPHKRMKFAQEFQKGKGRVIVITKALSEGVTLTRAHHLVINDYPWVPGDLKQVIARIDRLGQTKTCVIHRILGSPQDEYILKAIEEKTKVIEKVT